MRERVIMIERVKTMLSVKLYNNFIMFEHLPYNAAKIVLSCEGYELKRLQGKYIAVGGKADLYKLLHKLSEYYDIEIG